VLRPVIPFGVCVRCAAREVYAPKAEYCAGCRRAVDSQTHRRWEAARVLAAIARRPACLCVDCATPIAGSMRGHPLRCFDCRLEWVGAPRCAIPDGHPALAAFMRLARTRWRACADCGARFDGRADRCLGCRAARIYGGGELSCPVRYCRGCGAVLGPRPLQKGGHYRVCASCRDREQFLAAIPYLERGVAMRARWRRLFTGPEIEEALSGVRQRPSPRAPARDLRTCVRRSCFRPKVAASHLCFEHEVEEIVALEERLVMREVRAEVRAMAMAVAERLEAVDLRLAAVAPARRPLPPFDWVS
jgi:hypothetical protein